MTLKYREREDKIKSWRTIKRASLLVNDIYLLLFLLPGRNEILASFCPQVFGLYLVKLAVAMVLAGGVQRTDAAGTRVRGW